MLNSMKKWAIVAAVFGGALFQGGCLGLGNAQTRLILSILNEDIFG